MSVAPAHQEHQLIAAQAVVHQHYFIGLQLMVAMRAGPEAVEAWMFELFRRQHEDKFLSSFNKLGLDGQPDAIACAKYHVLSNGVGGVQVEYMEESKRKAWVRYRYPRWWLDGPAVCGIPVEASRGFMRGWHANNGVSLRNPRLGFVCVSEDMTGEFGFCGYFQEYDRTLNEDERLRFAKDERPPRFDPKRQPTAPADIWGPERLVKANRNYAVEFVRNGVAALVVVLGRDRALELSMTAARLIGLQQYSAMATAAAAKDGDARDAAHFLAAMFRGMGDSVAIEPQCGARTVQLRHEGLRVVRGLSGEQRNDLLCCWIELWKGAIASHREFFEVEVRKEPDALIWVIGSP